MLIQGIRDLGQLPIFDLFQQLHRGKEFALFGGGLPVGKRHQLQQAQKLRSQKFHLILHLASSKGAVTGQ
jgi:hypothetical protein